jgi:hypothetical protein
MAAKRKKNNPIKMILRPATTFQKPQPEKCFH